MKHRLLLTLLALLAVATICAADEQKKLKVVTIHDPPYVLVENDTTHVTSFNGFVPDLLTYVTKKLGYAFEVTSVQKLFGAQDRDGKWTGMMQVLDQRLVDLGAAALTKNDERRKVVDFSTAFLSTQLQLLTHKNRTHLRNISDLALPHNNSVPFGAIREGNTYTLLTKSPTNDEALRMVGQNLTPVGTTGEGVELVRQDKFVMIMEGLTADYWVSKYPCDLATSQGHLFEVEYAFAVRKYFAEGEFIKKLNEELDQRETKDKIAALRAKYWTPTHCEDGQTVAGGAAAVRPLAVVGHVVSWLVVLLACTF